MGQELSWHRLRRPLVTGRRTTGHYEPATGLVGLATTFTTSLHIPAKPPEKNLERQNPAYQHVLHVIS